MTIVEFSDFQCPFCSRVVPTRRARSEGLRRSKVRLFFRHNPLPFHPNAPLAAEAAVAAEAQGKFWEMHDKMFANQQALERPDLEKYAREIGLDIGKFKAALDSGTGKARVDADLALGKQIGVQGTPNFYIDGRNMPGRAAVRGVQEGHRRRAQARRQADRQGDAARPGLRRVHEGGEGVARRRAAAGAKGPGAGTEVYKVAVGDAPTRAASSPRSPIVEFSDFQCPYCSRVNAHRSTTVLKDYGKDVSVTYRHNPLPFHNNAMPAALAAEAAREQGKFWEMHDKLFAGQQNLDRPSLDKYAQEIGLNMAKFKEAMDKEKGKERIKRDMDDAEKFGARGTPNFFINGRNFRGAQPIEAFKSVIDEEIKKADAKIAAGTPRGQVYAALIAGRARQGGRAAAAAAAARASPTPTRASAPRSRARR